MTPLTTLIRSLGNDGARANAQRVLQRREREEWLVQGLARNLERREASAASRPASAGSSAAA